MQTLHTFLDKLAHFAGTRTARRLVLGVFLVQIILLSFIMHIGTPPDEQNHVEFIEYYAHHSLSPILTDQAPTWSLGDKTREADYLYHYVASFVARLVPGETADVYALRLLSVLMAFASMVLLARLLQRLGVSAAATTVTLAVLTNLPMVLMVSAAVNNDVYVWLGYILGLLLVYRIWQRPTLLDLMWLLTLVAAGGLVKRTLYPVGALLVAAAFVVVAKKWKTFTKSLTKLDWRIWLAAAALLLATGLFVERVGGNLYQYGKVAPSCDQVQGEKACDVFWASSRERWLKAGAPAEKNIWLPEGTVQDESPMSLPVFTVKWLVTSVNNIVDIQTQGWGHKVMPPIWLAPALLVVLVIAIGYGMIDDVKQWRRGKRQALWRLFAIATALFIMVAHLYVNYSTYATSRVFGLALNGRYILPSLLVLAGLASYYLIRLLPRRSYQILAVVTILCVVLFSGLIMMLRNSQLVTG